MFPLGSDWLKTRLLAIRSRFFQSSVSSWQIFEAKAAFPLRQAEKLFYNLPISTLSDANRELIESTITTEEVLAVIKTLKPHKRPGPDGLPSPYYKKFATELAPLLTNIFNTILGQHSFGRDTLTALISMIPKPNTKKIHCGLIIDQFHS